MAQRHTHRNGLGNRPPESCEFHSAQNVGANNFLTGRKKEYDFQILDVSWTKFGPNSENRLRMGSGSEAKHRKSLPNRRQQGAPSALPKGAALRAAPLGSCCLPFGKDFLSFASLPGPLLGRFPEFGPNLAQDPSRI